MEKAATRSPYCALVMANWLRSEGWTAASRLRSRALSMTLIANVPASNQRDAVRICMGIRIACFPSAAPEGRLHWGIDVSTTSIPAPRSGLHAFSGTGPAGPADPGSLPLLRRHFNHSAGLGPMPGVFRREADRTGFAECVVPDHGRIECGRYRGSPHRNLEDRGVSGGRALPADEGGDGTGFRGVAGADPGPCRRGVSR